MYRESSVLYVLGTELNKIERNGVDSFQKEKELLLFSISFYVQVEEEEYSVGVHLSVGTTRRRAGDAQRSPVAHTHKPSGSFLLLFFLFFFFLCTFSFFFVEIIICWGTVRMLQRTLLLWGFHVFPGKR